jgi:hypothetical protein
MTATNLFQLVARPDSVPSAIFWTKTIAVGFPRESFSLIAEKLGFTEKKFSQVSGLRAPQKKQELLDSDSSELLYRIEAIREILADQHHWTPLQIKSWLTEPSPALRKRVPIELLKSSMGFEYAVTAASRV